MKPKIFVFCNRAGCRGQGDWHYFVAVAEDGTGLAVHICSHHSYARHDMGVDENGWKRDLYAEHYPDGFEVELVEGDHLQHAGLMAAIERHTHTAASAEDES